ncbi:MAG: GlsB/YeaQ/YmgE family stress response membrane protein [Treponema sp.]|uniref:GlsB/YeaQ/YmgE family stress response membrane protein n=1 Tax=Treponema sp. TaxID=166 RepID=UPI0025DDEAF6|nr:GlsB/YeaQ/YmgE family stress response membrane protein [Treponema sp.]MBQ9283251.1 GlsB/YeaQ/YmgE family stress response membrane protein [Treponema sp.]
MIATIIMGLIVGLLGGFFMKVSFGGSTLVGFIVCVLVGIVGSFIGGCLGSALKIKNTVLQFVLDVVGACLLIALLKVIF